MTNNGSIDARRLPQTILTAWVLAAFLQGCAGKPVAQDSSQETPTTATAASTDAPIRLTTEEPKAAPVEAPSPPVAVAAPVEKKADDHAQAAAPGVPADKSLGWLKNGNTRFLKSRLRNDGATAKDRTRLVNSQHPHAIVLSCSDSRVPPELVFDQKLGELFVVRTAGEALDSSSIASMEYAVAHLGTKLLVVMGHSNCGAVKAAMQTPEGQSAGSPALDSLVADIKPRLKAVWDGRSPASENLSNEVAANANGVGRDLLTRSEIIRKKVESGELKIVSAVYHLDSGEVKFQ